MSRIALPNIKKLFIPDEGYIILNCDLAQADAQVVAWEAEDDALKEIFRDPKLDLHNENAKAIFGNVTKANRQKAKGGVHAVNYGVAARTLAIALGITVHEAELFKKRWFDIHPGIVRWQERVEEDLVTTRSVTNKFGNSFHFFDRIQRLLPEALAWVPQSTVALVINRGLVALDRELPEVQPLMQVHDSLVMQVKKADYHRLLLPIKECLEVVVPYDDPLIIPVGCEASSRSYGEVQAVSWETGRLLEAA